MQRRTEENKKKTKKNKFLEVRANGSGKNILLPLRMGHCMGRNEAAGNNVKHAVGTRENIEWMIMVYGFGQV